LYGYDFVYAPDGQKVIGDDGLYMRTQQLVPLGSVYLISVEFPKRIAV
jgi:hypothetical protein